MIRATAHVLRGVGVRHAVKTLVRRALEDVGVSHDAAAAFADVSRQRIEHQLDTAHDAQPPMFLLAVLPAEVRERIIVALRALHDDRAIATGTAESASAVCVSALLASVDEIVRAISDGRVTSLERPGMRRGVAALRSQCDSLLRLLGEDEDRRRVQ